MDIKKGDIISVVIKRRIETVGLFVKLEDGRDGLIHRKDFLDFEEDWVEGRQMRVRVTRVRVDGKIDLLPYQESHLQMGDIVTVKVAHPHEKYGLFVWIDSIHKALVHRSTFSEFDKAWIPGLELKAVVLGIRTKEKISLALVPDDAIAHTLGDIVSVEVESHHTDYGLYVRLKNGKEGVILQDSLGSSDNAWSKGCKLLARITHIGLGGALLLEIEQIPTKPTESFWTTLSRSIRKVFRASK